ncbi:hypothetical protein [Streptomyces sp. NPDC001401]|uniref:hypothetical protein n=1 Tax=Streptomyces sp. NPDC001401 TaxID=3364570 RepID=UPI0036A71999
MLGNTRQLEDRAKVSSGGGAAWNAVVGVGDLTGDGKNGLVARDTSGSPYRYDGKANGSCGARVKIGARRQGCKGLF